MYEYDIPDILVFLLRGEDLPYPRKDWKVFIFNEMILDGHLNLAVLQIEGLREWYYQWLDDPSDKQGGWDAMHFIWTQLCRKDQGCYEAVMLFPDDD